MQLRSKKKLIERFVNEHMPNVKKSSDMRTAFSAYWEAEKDMALESLCAEEGLHHDKVKDVIEAYHFTGRAPLRDTIVSALVEKPKVLERKSIVERVTEKVLALVQQFDDDMGDV